MPKERQTCTECSMRRQKCDREQPCSRCIKRGEPDNCTREWPNGGYDPRKHRVYPRPEKGDNPSPDACTGNEQKHESPRPPAPAKTQASKSSESRTARDLNSVINPPATKLTAPSEQEKEVLEFLTWGRGNLADYQVKSFDLLKEPFKNNARPCPEQEYSNGFGNALHQQLSFLQLLLPKREQLFYLIDYHIKTVLWYHACFHGETFRGELQAQYINSGTLQLSNTDLRWSSLLFAIMSATMACANDHLTASWGFQKGERAKLMRQWYKASLTCLNLSDYMWRHHLNSISAICVLTMSGHILGFSNTQSTLHGAGLKIAQGLGLQRLGLEPDEGTVTERDMTPARKEKILRREVGRRVWGQLCNQDWFSIPFSEMYTIQKSHFSTSRPQHIDERTLLPLPAHEPSSTSFTRCLNAIAAILPQAHDALTNASTLYTKYEQILHYDAKMKALSLEGIPNFLSMTEIIRPEWPDWLPWARRSLRICFAHKTIMVHRSFLGKSLSDPTFAHTRKTCMEASKVILKEARQAQDASEGPALWIDQAFMVAAGITLSLDIFHRKTSEPEYEEHRKLVETTVNMLRKFDYSLIAIRGVRLLTSLLAEQARLTAEKSMNSYKKRARDDDTTSTTPGGTVASPDFLHVGDGSSFTNAIKKQKFDVPKFLESFVGGDTSFTQSLRTPANPTFTNDSDTVVPSSLNANGDLVLGNGRLGNLLMQQQPSDKLPALETSDSLDALPRNNDLLGLPNEYGYEAFEQIFPPHAGINDDVSEQRARSNSGSEYLAFPSENAGDSVQSVQESAARARMRKQFLPMFMKLKQPAIPGVWGSWDPSSGSESVTGSDWPAFNPADAPLENISSTSIPENDKEKTANEIDDTPIAETLETAYLPAPVSETELSTQTQGLIVAGEVQPLACFPPQTFFPVHKGATTQVQVDGSLEYVSPVSSPRPLSSTLDVDKDLAVKAVMVEARKTYGNGPMWGVAAPPPMTFDGTEDYGEIAKDGLVAEGAKSQKPSELDNMANGSGAQIDATQIQSKSDKRDGSCQLSAKSWNAFSPVWKGEW